MAPSPPETSSKPETSPSVPQKTSAEGAGPAASPPEPAPAVVKENGEEKASAESAEPANMWDIIDKETLEQILELDEGDHEFSKGMAWAYFEQVDTTFEEMDTAYDAKDLKRLSELGHFLKGSSAALGVSKVQLSCEQMQHYGNLRDEEAEVDLSEEDALSRIESTLARVKEEYAEAEKCLKAYYAKLDADLDDQ